MSGRGQSGRLFKGNGNTGCGDQQKKSKVEVGQKSLQKHIYYIGSSNQAHDIVVVTKVLMNHIWKTYTYGKDIGQALELRKPFEF